MARSCVFSLALALCGAAACTVELPGSHDARWLADDTGGDPTVDGPTRDAGATNEASSGHDTTSDDATAQADAAVAADAASTDALAADAEPADAGPVDARRRRDGSTADACRPTTCTARGKNCGTLPDGCGGTLACGRCTSPATCGGGGVANVCGGGSDGTIQGPPAGLLFDATDGSKNYLRSPIPANPAIDPASAALVSQINPIPTAAAGSDWTIPMIMTTNADPLYRPSLTYASAWGCTVGSAGIHIPDSATVERPVGTAGDGWIATVNTEDGTVRAIWQAEKIGGTWKGSCAGSFPIHGNGFNVAEGVGTGSGSQIGAGQVLFSEMARGVVDHALYMTSTRSCTSYREPARKSDGHQTSNCFPMGARFQLDPSVSCDDIGGSYGEIVICKTLQRYGAYVLDSGGAGPLSGITFQGDDLTDPGRAPWAKPGNGARGTPGCSPVSGTCGQWAHWGITTSPATFSHIPWRKLRMLRRWDGS